MPIRNFQPSQENYYFQSTGMTYND